MATRDDVIREIDRLSELPILPQILIKLNKVAEDDNASAEDLGRIILKDQSLTLQVLKVVNSACYRQQKRECTTTVSQAVVILGFNGVRRLALGMSVYDTLKTANTLPGLQNLWSHSLTVAITSRLVAACTGYYSAEEAFVAGLVHDIGRVVLARCDPELYGRIIARTSDSAELRNQERKLFGMSHALAGKRLAHHWSLPAAFEEVIGGHHAYETEALVAGARLLRIVVGANRFAHALMDGADAPALQRAMDELGQSFGLSVAQVQEIYRSIWQEYAELAQAFQIGGGVLDAQAAAGALRPDIDREELLARLQAIAAAMVAPDSSEQLPNMILDAIMASVAVERLFLLTLDEDGRRLVCRTARGSATLDQIERFRVAVTPEGGITARTILEQRAFHVADTAAPAVQAELNSELLALLGTSGFATVPLLYRGHAIGALWFDNPASRRPLAEPLRATIGTLANNLALALGALAVAPGAARDTGHSPAPDEPATAGVATPASSPR